MEMSPPLGASIVIRFADSELEALKAMLKSPGELETEVTRIASPEVLVEVTLMFAPLASRKTPLTEV
jgi:hypothetical protein